MTNTAYKPWANIPGVTYPAPEDMMTERQIENIVKSKGTRERREAARLKKKGAGNGSAP